MNLPGARYDSAHKVFAFYRDLLARSRAIPGVEGAAVVSSLPVTAPSWSSDFAVEGRGPEEFGIDVLHREISPDYPAVMRVPLIEGRHFTPDDTRGRPLVVLVNEALARRWFPGESPVGRRIAFDRYPDSTSYWRTIVGVVGSERQGSLGMEARPEILAPFEQDWRTSMTLVLRARGRGAPLAPAVRRIIHDLDPVLDVSAMREMDDVRAASLARERFLTTLLIAFSLVGTVLAVVGVFGVIAQAARARTREIGIRVALGAGAPAVQWLVVRHGLRLGVAGVAVGLGGAGLGGRVIGSLLYGVRPADPGALLAVAILLLGASFAASWLPAWRAARVDPAVTLRAE
jgi:putative ABC transport system permease protein